MEKDFGTCIQVLLLKSVVFLTSVVEIMGSVH